MNRRKQPQIAGPWSVLAVVLALAASLPADARPQGARGPCTWTASLGIAGWRIDNGTITTRDDGTVRYEFRTEPVITRLHDDGPADGRLRPGDVLVRVDGHLITTPAGWRRLERIRPGDRVLVEVRRDGRVTHATLRAGEECRRTPAPAPPVRALEMPRIPEMPSLPDMPRIPALPAPPAPVVAEQGAHLGLSFACDLCIGRLQREGEGGRIRWEFHDPPRLDAVMRGGPAWEGGLRSGDLLVAVNEREITTEAGWEAFASLEPGAIARMTVERGGERRTFTIVPEETPRRYVVAGTPAAPRPSYAAADADSPLRYSEVIGDVAVEVRGDPANAYYDRERGELIIRAPGTWIRIRLTEGARR